MTPSRSVGFVGQDAAGRGEAVAGGLQGGGEAGPVGIGAGAGLHRLDHGYAQQLVGGQQSPDLLFQAGPVLRAQHVTGQQGVSQGEVGGLDLPPLVVEPDEVRGRVLAVVEQGW